MTATTKALSKKALTKPKQPTVMQGTQEWRLLRCGKVTASRIADVINFKENGEESAARRDYRLQVVTEMLTGIPYDYGFETPAMRWGKETEPLARIVYAELVGTDVEQIAFIDHPTIPRAGASPDGLIGKDGLLELKCPASFTHLNYLLIPGLIKEDYMGQVQWQLACTGRKWCDLVSYDPRMPEHLRVFIKHVKRDDVYISTITKEVNKFIDECRALVTTLEHYAPTPMSP